MSGVITVIKFCDFNPRSHERSDPNRLQVFPVCFISIHAPTRGATFSGCSSLTGSAISIHAPTRGATVLMCSSTLRFGIFQSTLPREERRRCSSDLISVCTISIHAPTRGATPCLLFLLLYLLFQSTLPREERQSLSVSSDLVLRYFNPRSHERSDSNIAQKICLFLYNTDNKYIIR